jgi:pimeloyl-ACP methyl ester carboxylesterase/uncharacterized protein YukE
MATYSGTYFSRFMQPMTDMLDALATNCNNIQKSFQTSNDALGTKAATLTNTIGTNESQVLTRQNQIVFKAWDGVSGLAFQNAIKGQQLNTTTYMNILAGQGQLITAITSFENTMVAATNTADQELEQQSIEAQGVLNCNNNYDVYQVYITFTPTSMITRSIALATFSSITQNGLQSDLFTWLTKCYEDVYDNVFLNNTDLNMQVLVGRAVTKLYQEVQTVYTTWVNALIAALADLARLINWAATTGQTTGQMLHNQLTAGGVFALINTTQSTTTPISISMGKDGTLLVTIAGTDMPDTQWDTNVFNALETGQSLNPDSPYVLDVKAAIDQYIMEHNLKDPRIVLAGYSLGGMVAQIVAQDPKYLVTDVVTYGSPTMGDPVPGIHYTLYFDHYDPIPVLSRYENSSLPPNNAVAAGVVATLPFTWPYLGSEVYQILHNADGLSFSDKIAYMDPHHLYQTNGNSIVPVKDVGNNLMDGPPIMSPHLQYFNSTQLETTKVPSFQQLGTLSQTEYFGMPTNNPYPLW